jgi:hypothetical protein
MSGVGNDNVEFGQIGKTCQFEQFGFKKIQILPQFG